MAEPALVLDGGTENDSLLAAAALMLKLALVTDVSPLLVAERV